MNKLLILAVIIAVVSADCKVYDVSQKLCGSGTDCLNSVKKQTTGCTDCTVVSNGACGESAGTNCFAFTLSQDQSKCTLDCTVADTTNSACSTNYGCKDYTYNSTTKKCALPSSAAQISFAAILLLAFLF